MNSTTIAAGGSTSIDYWLVNFGKASASASTTGIYLSTDATITTSDTLLTTVGSTGLAANGASGYFDHQTITLTMSGSLAPGTYYIGGIADYTNAIAESNEANNNHEVTKIIVTAPAHATTSVSALSTGSENFMFAADLDVATSNSLDRSHVPEIIPSSLLPAELTQGTDADAHHFVPQDTAIAELLQHYLSDFHFV